MKFPFIKEKDQLNLILDLGTEAVKALIVEERKNIVLGAETDYLSSESFETVKKSIIRATTAVQDKTKTAPKSVTLGLPADILKARVSLQNHRRVASKKIIDSKEEKAICQKIRKQSSQEICKQISQQTGILEDDLLFVDFKILETKIDGYQVSTLNGFSGRNLEFRILAVFMPKYIEKYGNCGFEFLKKNIQELGWKDLKIACPWENLLKTNKVNNALYLDVGGTLTQFIIIENDKLKRIREFKIGGENFTQLLSQTLGISEERARILKHKYTEKLVSEPTRDKIKEIISPGLYNWFNALKEQLARENSLIPDNIFLLGGGSLLPEISEILVTGDWENIHFLDEIKIKNLYPQDLNLASIDFNNLQYTPALLLSGAESLNLKYGQ